MQLEFDGRVIRPKERLRRIRFKNVLTDWADYNFDAMKVWLRSPAGVESTHTLVAVVGDDNSLDLDNTIDIFEEHGNYQAEIYADDGNPDPELRSGIFTIPSRRYA